MPHKHTRKGEIDKSLINLPPTHHAKPLPVSRSTKTNLTINTPAEANKKSLKKGRSKIIVEDDTPKAFARLMSFHRGERLPKGLDDGIRPIRKEKKKIVSLQQTQQQAIEMTNTSEIPKIRPGEKMSDFGARVDAALPVRGLINKSSRKEAHLVGLKNRQTKMEKRMHKMYDRWREEEARRREKVEEMMEIAEEEMYKVGQVKWEVDMTPHSKKRKGKKKQKRTWGEVDDGEDDPWAKIKTRRGEKKITLHDVAKAPPIFSNLPKNKFRIKKEFNGSM